MIKLTDFGAVLELPGGETGMLHISQVSHEFVRDIRDYVGENDVVKVMVVGKRNGKLELSRKVLEEKPRKKAQQTSPEFEQMLRNFLRSSSQRQGDIKRREMRRNG